MEPVVSKSGLRYIPTREYGENCPSGLSVASKYDMGIANGRIGILEILGLG